MTAVEIDPTKWRWRTRLAASGIELYDCVRCDPPVTKSHYSLAQHDVWHSQRAERQEAAREVEEVAPELAARLVSHVRALVKGSTRAAVARELGLGGGVTWRIDVKGVIKPEEVAIVQASLERHSGEEEG